MNVAGRLAPARVVVVEDSLVQRANLVAVLEADGDIIVVGEASTAPEAIQLVTTLRPDVVTLDLNIPGGGGQHALEQIMASTPTPILVLSATVGDDSSAPAIDALVGGALLALPKPLRWTTAFEAELRRNVRTVRGVPVIRHLRGSLRGRQVTAPSIPSPTHGACVVAIAASTGGPAALATVLAGLAGLPSPVMVVQHIHPDFVQGLVDWMSRISPLSVAVAQPGERLRDGCVYIGPGGVHLTVGRDRRIELLRAPEVAHRPSADQLFESVAANVGANSVGVVLTGMGDDGAAGLAAMHRCGAATIAQDQATSAVYGMPRAAARLGGVDQQLGLNEIATGIMRAARSRTQVTR